MAGAILQLEISVWNVTGCLLQHHHFPGHGIVFCGQPDEIDVAGIILRCELNFMHAGDPVLIQQHLHPSARNIKYRQVHMRGFLKIETDRRI